MTVNINEWRSQLQSILAEFSQQIHVKKDQVIVIGCSTSEVLGEKIGTAGALEVAEMIFEELNQFSRKFDIHLAFQCCEHLNRALVVERKLAEKKNWDEVTVIPVRHAGGSMATCAYHHFTDPVVVEFIKADAGIDIGDTFIGMHLKHVAVPVRVSKKQIGSAHVTLAVTRPKLIGGQRAVYEK
ncbi:TIGR01440 family protein [Heyndrickxia ginsengihumi]|uniref:TIGR01440 family protein n=1 Tax=Heyndrickxia ginsengihumi TaxID=363870 RepID=UPI003D225A61